VALSIFSILEVLVDLSFTSQLLFAFRAMSLGLIGIYFSKPQQEFIKPQSILNKDI